MSAPSLTLKSPPKATKDLYAPTKAFLDRRKPKVPEHYVAIRGTARRPVNHVIRAADFRDAATRYLKGHMETVCGVPVQQDWTLVPKHDTTVTCVICASRLHRENR